MVDTAKDEKRQSTISDLLLDAVLYDDTVVAVRNGRRADQSVCHSHHGTELVELGCGLSIILDRIRLFT